ncbi:hypothetical protein [Streptomyces sp. bgisy100]|uniref:hypothetical protein n=1 Tax=Streptomyces sp. bgisy100 TaxID=3413783 RepID=UPI003D7607BA
MTVCAPAPETTADSGTLRPTPLTISAEGSYGARLAGGAETGNWFPERWTLGGPEPYVVPLPGNQPEEPDSEVLPLADGRVLISRRVADRYAFSLLYPTGPGTGELSLGGVVCERLTLLPPVPGGTAAYALAHGEHSTALWRVYDGRPREAGSGPVRPEHVVELRGRCSGGAWLDRTGRLLALDQQPTDGRVKTVAVDLGRGGAISPLLQITEESNDRLLLADPDSGLLLVQSDAPGHERLGWGVLGSSRPVRFPETLRLPDAAVTPFAVQPGQMLMPENCAVALRIDGAGGSRVGVWRPSGRELRQLTPPHGWLAGAGLWTPDGELRLPYATAELPCGLARMTAGTRAAGPGAGAGRAPDEAGPAPSTDRAPGADRAPGGGRGPTEGPARGPARAVRGPVTAEVARMDGAVPAAETVSATEAVAAVQAVAAAEAVVAAAESAPMPGAERGQAAEGSAEPARPVSEVPWAVAEALRPVAETSDPVAEASGPMAEASGPMAAEVEQPAAEPARAARRQPAWVPVALPVPVPVAEQVPVAVAVAEQVPVPVAEQVPVPVPVPVAVAAPTSGPALEPFPEPQPHPQPQLQPQPQAWPEPLAEAGSVPLPLPVPEPRHAEGEIRDPWVHHPAGPGNSAEPEGGFAAGTGSVPEPEAGPAADRRHPEPEVPVVVGANITGLDTRPWTEESEPVVEAWGTGSPPGMADPWQGKDSASHPPSRPVPLQQAPMARTR